MPGALPDSLPTMIMLLRVVQLVYNGDADACVPYIGNEEWINDALVGPGLITEAEAWRPWFTADTPDMPAGYVTTYDVKGGSSQLTFLTIRLAGHSKSDFVTQKRVLVQCTISLTITVLILIQVSVAIRARWYTLFILRIAVVPMFQPEPALTFFERFLAGEPQ